MSRSADDPDVARRAFSAADSSRRADRSADDPDPERAARVRSNQAWSGGSSTRLHRRDERSAPDRWARYSAGSSIGPKWADTKIDRPAGRRPRRSSAGVSTHDPLVEERGRRARASAGSRGSSGRRGGRRAGRAARARAGRGRRRGPGRRPRPSRVEMRPRAGRSSAGPARREPARRGTRCRRPRRRARRRRVRAGGRRPTMRPGSGATRARWPGVPRPVGGARRPRARRPVTTLPAPARAARSDSASRARVAGVRERRRVRRRRTVAEHPRRARLELGRLLGRRRPHRLEAVPLLRGGRERRLERVGDLLGRPGDVRVGRATAR